MPSPARIALVSCPVKYADKEANLKLMENALREYSTSRAELFVFPELNICGFVPPGAEREWVDLAETVPDGPSSTWVMELARKYDKIICAGIVENYNENYYLTHFLCGPKGYIGKQRKLLSQNPLKNGPLSPGDGLCTFELFGHNCVILACADWTLPDAVYLTGLAEAALIIAPTDGMKLNSEGIMRSAALARTLDTKACLVAVFGGNPWPDKMEVLAGIAAIPTDNGSEIVLRETRMAGEIKVMQVELNLQQPQHWWGGFRGRVDMLRANLDRYQENNQC